MDTQIQDYRDETTLRKPTQFISQTWRHAHRVSTQVERSKEQDILMINVLFPAINLLMVKVGNSFVILWNLIRHLRDEVILENISSKDSNQLMLQIGNFRDPLRLTRITQWWAAIAFVLTL